jgi:hypothetical protein
MSEGASECFGPQRPQLRIERGAFPNRQPAGDAGVLPVSDVPPWPAVLLSAPLVRPCVLRWLGWDVASIERVSALEAHQRDVLYVEVVELGAAASPRGTPG